MVSVGGRSGNPINVPGVSCLGSGSDAVPHGKQKCQLERDTGAAVHVPVTSSSHTSGEGATNPTGTGRANPNNKLEHVI